MRYRHCNNCDIEYLAKRSNSKFCSSSCRIQNHQKKDQYYKLLNAKNGIDLQMKKSKATGMELACKKVNKELRKRGVNISFGVYIDDKKGLVVLVNE